jgi:hypothetical protein
MSTQSGYPVSTPCEYSEYLVGVLTRPLRATQVRCCDGRTRGAERKPHGGECAARRGAGGARGGECAARRALRPL